MKRFLKNEEGNATLLTIWSMFIVGLLLVVVVNIAKIYISNEQAGTAAEQASLAATGIIYQEIEEAIESYVPEEDDDEGDEEDDEDAEPEESLQELVEDEIQALTATGRYHEKEAKIQAINRVLLAEIPGDSDLRSHIESALQTASQLVYGEVSQIVTSNNGNMTQTTIRLFNEDYRIEVETAATYEQVAHSDFIAGQQKQMPQKGYGHQVEFLEVVSWSNQSF